MKEMLTPRMQDRITKEESGHGKIRERDRSDALLAYNINPLVREERTSAFNRDQVVKGYDSSNRKRSSSAANNCNNFRPEKGAKLSRRKDGSTIRTTTGAGDSQRN